MSKFILIDETAEPIKIKMQINSDRAIISLNNDDILSIDVKEQAIYVFPLQKELPLKTQESGHPVVIKYGRGGR